MFTDDSFEKKGFDTETFEADSNNCFICSKPANNQRGVNVKTQPRIDNKDGDLWLCDEHNNLFDFGLFANGNLLAWTHPNGTEYLDKGEFSKRLKNAESDKLHGWATTMLRDVKDLIEDLENGAVYDLDDCRERLEKIRDDTSHLNAESDMDKVKHHHYKDMIAHLESRNDLSEMDRVKLQHYKDMVKMNAEGFGAESNVAYTVYGIDDMNDLNNMSYWMEGGYHHDKEDAIAEAKEWWSSRNTLPLDEGGGVVKVWVSKTFEEGGVVDEMEEIVSYGAESFAADHSWIEVPKPEGYLMDKSIWRTGKHWKCEYCHEIKHTNKAKPHKKGCAVGDGDGDEWLAESFEAKGIDTLAEPFEEMGISKPYARLGVIAAGITALAFGVNKIRK